MDINIYKDQMQKAYLFGTAVLHSAQPIPREDVPQYWFSYDHRGTDRQPDRPYALVDQADQNYTGSILSPLPLKKGTAQSRLVKDKLELTGEYIQLADFCSEYHIQTPQTPIRHMLRPASPDEAGLFYALEPEFKEELGKVVDDLRQSVLKDLSSMRRYCRGHDGEITGGSCCQNYGFVLETERYTYRLRCNPISGDYQAYLSCFDKQAQQMGLSEKGRQMLQDAADPAEEHSYSWYVIENINDPERRVDHQLPLEEAIQLYAALDCEDKRLGIDKDDIACVDLAIRWDGREWISEDWRKSDSFAQDPVVADAVEHLRQALEEPSQGQGMTMGAMM